MPGPLRRGIDGARFAIAFLTVVPLRVPDARGAAVAPAWFAAVGAVIGAVAGGAFAAAEPAFGSPVAAVLAVGTLVVLTGALHLDGLADCADGLGVRADRERRLRVMRDPAIGTFGALALLLWALLATTSIAQLASAEAVRALVCAAALGRWAALLHARWAPPARQDGLGSAFAPSASATAIAGAVAVVVIALIQPVQAAGIVVVSGVLIAAAISAWARRALGGRTGDTLGATVAVAEVVAVMVALALG